MRRVALTGLLGLLLPLAAIAQEDHETGPAATAPDAAAVDSRTAPEAPEYRAALARLEANVSFELRQLENGQLGRYRRRDGTLEWERLLQEGALPVRADGHGLPHLPLGVFLRELARAVTTEDRTRVEELFQGASQTDLYHRHGLLSLGGRLTAVPFAPRLQRFLGPAFVRQLLRAQSDLAVAHLLPQLARGRLHRRTFAVSLAGLGLDTRTVRDELAAMPWVAKIGGYRLAKNLGLLHKFGKLGTVGGFMFVVAETVVTVYFADDVEAWLRSIRDRFVARQTLAAACLRLSRRALVDERPLDADTLRDELELWDLHWGRWRDHLLAPALAEEARLAEALVPLARRAAQLEEARAALVARAPAHPALIADLVARHGSLEGWWEARSGEEEQELRGEVERRLGRHAERLQELLREAYAPDEDPSRFPADAHALKSAASLQRLAAFTRPTTARLGTYQEQRQMLEHLRVALAAERGAGSPLLEPIDEARELIARTEALDRALVAPRPADMTSALDGR